ncbi:MAG: hypothetical protein H8E34_06320 [Bacteroidetes bacterium]|nr:hypothetical protein [Bacteroidota bacterium]
MKTLLKIFAVLTVIFVGLLFILPLIYKAEIINLTKKELNKSVNATIDFDDISLGLFKSFPDFNVSIQGLYIVGLDEFNSDTLVKINTISLAVDIFSVFNRENYEIKKIKLVDPIIKIKVLENGNANYNISLPDENNTNSPSSNDVESEFKLLITKFQITNGQLIYSDDELNTIVQLTGINHTLSGKLSSNNATLFTNTKVNNLKLTYDGIPYLSDVALVYKANIDADIKNEIYTLGKNELILNNLLISLSGSVSYINDDLNIVLTFNSLGNKFKDILSLIPSIYANDFEEVKTEGTFSVDGTVRGTYNENQLPSFNISTMIENGMFQYPDLPKSVKNITIKLNIRNKGGQADNTIIDISEFRLQLGDNPFNGSFKISTPISDPDIQARITGELDLSSIKDYYPVSETNNLNGNLIMDLALDGKLSSLEYEKYDEFLAMGSVVAKNVNYSSVSLNEPININNAQLNFSPKYIDLVNFKATTGKSDLQATGKIENYLAYYLNKGSLSGNLIANSNYLNIDEILVPSDTTDENMPSGNNQLPDTTENKSVIEIPDNINFTISSKFNKLIYDNLEMDNVTGEFVVSHKTLQFNKLSMEAVEGLMTVNGSYSTININNPEVDFNVKMEKLSIPVAFNQFAIFRKYLPLTKKATGLFSANFRINTLLDKEMMPVYSTMNGDGTISTKNIAVNELNSLTQIAELLNLDKLKNLKINDILAQFQFIEGKLIVKPTKFNYQNISGEIEGWTGMDQSIEYYMRIKIPRSEFGNDANSMLDGLLAEANNYGTNFSLPDVIPFNIAIGGTLDNPIVKTKLSKDSGPSIVDITQDEIGKEIKNRKEELGNEAAAKAAKIIDDADKQVRYLIQEAEKQAKLIRENAEDVVAKLNSETEKQAEALITEGKKNGFVAEMAAKEAAKQLRSGAANNRSDIIKEADKKADELIMEAKKASEKLKNDAQKQADDLKK